MTLPRHLKTLLAAMALSLALCDSTDINKGGTALGLGDYALAARFFSSVLERNPASYEARLGMGKALLQRYVDKNDTVSWREAVMNLEAARTLAGGAETTKLLAQVWAERGAALAHAGDTLGALEALIRSIACDPRGTEPLNLAGIIYYRIGKTAKARHLFESAVAADSSNISATFNLGMLCWEEKRIQEAHDHWMRALTGAPDDEDILYWFAAAEKSLRTAPADTALPENTVK